MPIRQLAAEARCSCRARVDMLNVKSALSLSSALVSGGCACSWLLFECARKVPVYARRQATKTAAAWYCTKGGGHLYWVLIG